MYPKFIIEVSSKEGRNGTGVSTIATMFVFRKKVFKVGIKICRLHFLPSFLLSDKPLALSADVSSTSFPVAADIDDGAGRSKDGLR